jgi:hypothetical protein
MAQTLRRIASFTPSRGRPIDGELCFDGRRLLFVPSDGGVTRDEEALKLGTLGIVLDGSTSEIPAVASALHDRARKALIKVRFERRKLA